MEAFKLSRSDAKSLNQMIEFIINTQNLHDIEPKLEEINTFLHGYGVEVIRTTEYQNDFWQDVKYKYINFGDTYATTLAYKVRSNRILICNQEDMVLNDKTIL